MARLLALFVALSTFLTVIACTENRPDFKEKDAAAVLEGADGIYRSEAAVQSDNGPYESLSYSELEIKGGQIVYRRLNEDTLSVESDTLGQLNASRGEALILTPQQGLNVSGKPQLEGFSAWFNGANKVRVIRDGETLKFTLMQNEGERSTSTWMRIQAGAAESTRGKVTTSLNDFKKLRETFFAQFGDKELSLVERIKERTAIQTNTPRKEVKIAADIKEEAKLDESLPDSKLNLQFKKLKFISPKEGQINGKHKADLRFLLLKGTERKMVVEITSSADPKLYVAAKIWGTISDETNDKKEVVGLKLVTQNDDTSFKRTETRRFALPEKTLLDVAAKSSEDMPEEAIDLPKIEEPVRKFEDDLTTTDEFSTPSTPQSEELFTPDTTLSE